MVIDGGIHAREWISPATALYLIEQATLHYFLFAQHLFNSSAES